MQRVEQKICQRNLIAAYVDGELSEVAAAIFEQHVEDCSECRAELRAHRQFVCELDAALTDKAEIAVPANFSKVIAVRARSDMRGVRTRSENKKAIAICAILALSGFALLGATASEALFVVAGKIFSAAVTLGGFVLSLVYDALTGFVVISRVMGQKLINESRSFVVALVFLVAGLFVLSRLISNYHRPGATE
jgi:anti-sigma factor RsiW